MEQSSKALELAVKFYLDRSTASDETILQTAERFRKFLQGKTVPPIEKEPLIAKHPSSKGFPITGKLPF